VSVLQYNMIQFISSHKFCSRFRGAWSSQSMCTDDEVRSCRLASTADFLFITYISAAIVFSC